MKKQIQLIKKSAIETLKQKKYFKLFLLISLIMITIYIIIPVLTIAGNDFLFQLSVFTIKDYLLLIILSSLAGLLITMQVYSYKKRKSLKETSQGVIGGSSGIIAGIFGTASCSSCIAAVFGFLGVGSVLFLVKYQWLIVGLSTIIMLIAIYFTAKGINKICETC